MNNHGVVLFFIALPAEPQSQTMVARQKFDSVCQELSKALSREQQAQELLNEQSRQLEELGMRLNAYSTQELEKEATIGEAVKVSLAQLTPGPELRGAAGAQKPHQDLLCAFVLWTVLVPGVSSSIERLILKATKKHSKASLQTQTQELEATCRQTFQHQWQQTDDLTK